MKNFSELGTLLTREEARKIIAGSAMTACMSDADCSAGGSCVTGYCVYYSGTGTCGYLGSIVEGKRDVRCYITHADAMFWFGSGGGGSHWCCDSCEQTGWFQEHCMN